MKKILIHNTKGGIGKTTITKAVAEVLAKANKKILIIDLDGQGNISKIFGISDSSYSQHWLKRQKKEDIKAYINDFLPQTIEKSKVDGIDVVSGGRELYDNLDAFKAQNNNEKVLGLNLTLFEQQYPSKYDYVFIDLNPAWDILTMNSYLIADSIISIIDRTEFAIASLIQNIKEWENKANDYEIDNKLKAVILNRIKNDKMSKEMIKAVNQIPELKKLQLKTFIPESANIEKSVVTGGRSAIDVKSFNNWKPSKAFVKWLEENKIDYKEGNPFYNLVFELLEKGIL